MYSYNQLPNFLVDLTPEQISQMAIDSVYDDHMGKITKALDLVDDKLRKELESKRGYENDEILTNCALLTLEQTIEKRKR